MKLLKRTAIRASVHAMRMGRVRRPSHLLALSIFTLAAGCGGVPDAACEVSGKLGTQTVRMSCVEFDELTDAQADEAARACNAQATSQVTTRVLEACSLSNVLGTCTIEQRGLVGHVYFYADGVVPVDHAKMACEEIKGKWTQN